MEELRSEIVSAFQIIESKQTDRVLCGVKRVSISPQNKANLSKNGRQIEKPEPLARPSEALAKKIAEHWENLAWQDFGLGQEASKTVLIGKTEDAPLLGSSQECEVVLLHVPKGSGISQFAEEANSWYHFLVVGPDAQIGFIQEKTRPIKLGESIPYLPAAPKVIKAGNELPLVSLVLRFGLLDGQQWLTDLKAGSNYADTIMKIPNIHEYYLEFVSDYEKVMRAWGYCMPEATVEFIMDHAHLGSDVKNVQVLDLGCGDGLVGLNLKKKGFLTLTGADFSENMLAKAKLRECYSELKQVNLLQDLPFQPNSFDLVVSVAVTTYLKPEVLRLWLKVAKKGGQIVFSHKTSIWDQWEVEQDAMEKEGLWKKVWIIPEPMPYLPSLKEDGQTPSPEMAKVYIYEKL
ncbi:hypothetical protein TCAL_02212 [Tigriopus californicus]|uniref:Methyltransferase type 11 domain-containing protein n=1 Tax=Tigriopus californicus TaxID=6832 RepID=A0A553P8H7_TIGCA|nr:uncharacterized protein LOC131877791 [Tigriopus californicus]TRY73970.1 hypothetical protein TCAL_02212 [Tigriopus californicus]|eukprot:TCALIF_02212-PA protein Name:"Similar to WBSCR27 Williams-Beuren syndrome chromosomal region 27 protein (Homo sapiens)" AED:0.01 eAED:0.01 QI:61/1/0.25/1/0.66/0.25/4/0/403